MSQAPKPPNPFDPVVEEQKTRMVNEGGHEPKPEDHQHRIKPSQTSATPDSVHTDDYGDVATSVNEAGCEPPTKKASYNISVHYRPRLKDDKF